MLDHGLPVARRFRHANIPGDNAIKHQRPERLADIVLHIMREIRAAVVHRQQNTGDIQIRVESLPNQAHVFGQLRHALESVKLALNRNDNFVRTGQPVNRQKAQ